MRCRVNCGGVSEADGHDGSSLVARGGERPTQLNSYKTSRPIRHPTRRGDPLTSRQDADFSPRQVHTGPSPAETENPLRNARPMTLVYCNSRTYKQNELSQFSPTPTPPIGTAKHPKSQPSARTKNPRRQSAVQDKVDSPLETR
jgi:hypothetical protein